MYCGIGGLIFLFFVQYFLICL